MTPSGHLRVVSLLDADGLEIARLDGVSLIRWVNGGTVLELIRFSAQGGIAQEMWPRERFATVQVTFERMTPEERLNVLRGVGRGGGRYP